MNMADEISRKVKIDVDVSEALTGLKAVTREAREATKALRELEEAHRKAQDIPIYFPLEEHTLRDGIVSGKKIDIKEITKKVSEEIMNSHSKASRKYGNRRR